MGAASVRGTQRVAVVLLHENHASTCGRIDSTLRIYYPSASPTHCGIDTSSLLSTGLNKFIWRVVISNVSCSFNPFKLSLPSWYRNAREYVEDATEFRFGTNAPSSKHRIIAIICSPVNVIG